jgi:2-methylcitrate dehydratase PrpD
LITTHPTEQLAAYVAGIRFESLPSEVVRKAKDCVLDTFGCVLEGAKSEDSDILRAALNSLGGGGVPVWGTSERASLQNIVLLHAAMAHATEYDDSHKQSKTHPGSIVVPAAFGAAILEPKTAGKRLIAAIVSGYELSLRIGMALGAAEHRLRGWHATATCGIFGAATAASRVLHGDADRMMSALGSAGTQAAGIWAFASDGSMSKQLNAGKAAQGGLLAAVLAQKQFTGSRYVLEARDGGFFSTFAPERGDEWKPIITDGLGERYELLNVAFKPYPCCRTTHCAIDAALALQARHDIPIEDIRQVSIRTYDIAIKQCGFSNPENPRQAMFSFPYITAVALMHKRPITSSDFSEASLRDTRLMALHDRVEVEFSEELDALFPQLWPCEVVVETVTGNTYSERVDVARGDPKAPMNRKDLEDKFFGCAEGVIPHQQAERIVSLVDRLEDLDDVNILWDSCTKIHTEK